MRRLTIIEKNRIEADKTKAAVSQHLFEYQLLQEEIRFKKVTLEIDRQLFAMQQAKYNSLEISPSEYLKVRKLFLNQLQNLQALRQQSELKRNLILIRSCWGLEYY